MCIGRIYPEGIVGNSAEGKSLSCAGFDLSKFLGNGNMAGTRLVLFQAM